MASDLVEQYAAIEGAPLGTGSYGSVGKVRRKRDLTILACKTIDIESESTSANKRRDYDRAKREVGILAKLHHPNIIRYNDAHWESRQVKLYMEMCDEGSLKNLVTEYSRKERAPSETYAWSIVYQLSNALAYCHYGVDPGFGYGFKAGKKWTEVLHRDIKPANVMLKSKSETCLHSIKLGDFGVGIELLPGHQHETYTVTTRSYMPPEITRYRRKWNTQCDIFSLGCNVPLSSSWYSADLFIYNEGTLFEFCQLKEAFEDHMNPGEEVPIISDYYSTELQHLVKDCMSEQPDKRPDAKSICDMAQTTINNRKEFKGELKQYHLLLAAEKGEIEAVQTLLRDGAPITARGGTDGESVLHRAVKSGNEELLSHLIKKHRLNMLDTSSNGETPLHCAAAAGYTSIALLLLRNGASIHPVDSKGWTPVHTAAANNCCDMIDALAEKKILRIIDVKTTYARTLTPLHIAAQNDDCGATVECLLKRGADIEAETETQQVALHLAADAGHVRILQILLDRSAKINSKGHTPKGVTALHLAASGGHAPALKVLLDHRAKKEEKTKGGETALHCAAESGQESAIEYLINEGANMHAETNSGQMALHLASEKGQAGAVECLLRLGAKVNAINRNFETALHHAARHGHEAVASVLLKNGAKINEKAYDQYTPLHLAAKYGRTGTITLLLQLNASLEEAVYNGETALLLASFHNKLETVEKLLEYNASTKATNKKRETALHLASKNGWSEIVEALLNRGADVKAKDSRGKSPYQVVDWNSGSREANDEIREAFARYM